MQQDNILEKPMSIEPEQEEDWGEDWGDVTAANSDVNQFELHITDLLVVR
jgi:hypothetical protein